MTNRHLLASAPLFLLLGILPLCTAHADGKKGKTNHELIASESDDLEAAEKKMNAAYEQLRAVLNDTGKAALQGAQEKWLAWREAQAEFDSHHLEGGKLRPLEAQGSRTRTTQARTAQLLADHKRFSGMR